MIFQLLKAHNDIVMCVESGGVKDTGEALASLAGFEPATGCLEGSCSIQLSYRDACGKRIDQFSKRTIGGQANRERPRPRSCARQVGGKHMSALIHCRFSVSHHRINGSRIRRVAVAQRA